MIASAAAIFQCLYSLEMTTPPLKARQSRLVDGGNGNQNSIVCSMTFRKLHSVEHNLITGQRIRRLRKQQNMTIQYLGELVGVSHQQMQRYETGDNSLSLYAAHLVAKALGVPTCEICGCREE